MYSCRLLQEPVLMKSRGSQAGQWPEAFPHFCSEHAELNLHWTFNY
jgi:hypothetical protein